MDVHLPGSIRTWKDFLLHLLTITIGLFIALTLEAAVESVHHRHLVREAHVNLRSEIEINHQFYAKNARELQKIDLGAARLETWMKALDDMYAKALTK